MKTRFKHYFPLLLFCVTFGLLFSFITVSSTIHAEEAEPVATETTNTTVEATTEDTSNANIQTTDTTTTEENTTTSANDPIKIEYDEATDIHSAENGTIILYCMNNVLHWPHDTPTFKAPTYTYVNIDTTKLSPALIQKIQTLLYAGYPYNGLNLYKVVSEPVIMSENEFNALLSPPDWLRSDFYTTLGDTIFTYDDYKNKTENYQKLVKFTSEMASYYGSTPSSVHSNTPSGHSHTDITNTSFYNAIYLMLNSNNPLEDYSREYGTDYAVTEAQAYKSTAYALWKLMYDNGITNNNISDVSRYPLAVKLLNASATLLSEEPTSDQIKVVGDTTFRYNKADGKWYTGTLTLQVPDTYYGDFTLTLPAGIETTTGVTSITNNGSFVLVSQEEPSKDTSMELASTLAYIYGKTRVYIPAAGAVDSNGKGFQNMVGAMIQQKKIAATTALSVEPYTEDSGTDPSTDPSTDPGTTPSTQDPASKTEQINNEKETKTVQSVATTSVQTSTQTHILGSFFGLLITTMGLMFITKRNH